jgi:uncharacterized protein (TIGR02246 family)
MHAIKARIFVLAMVLLAAVSSVTMLGQPALLSQDETDAIVLKFQTAYIDTFDRRDAKGMAVLFTENASLQNEWGDVVRGRANIEAVLISLMSHLPNGAKLEDTPIASRAIADGIIVSQGTSHRIVPNEKPAEMFFTRVLVRQGEEWLLAATQIARPSTFPKPSSPPKQSQSGKSRSICFGNNSKKSALEKA